MRRAAWFTVLAGAAAFAAPARAAVVTLSLSAGLAGMGPSASDEALFETPHGPPVVAVTSVPAGGTANAVTGGGSSVFSTLATPLLLDTAGGGSAYITSSSAPSPTAGGGGSGGLISAPPQPNAVIPSGAALLGIEQSAPGEDGRSTLTATLTDSAGNLLRSATVDLPGGGWWVLGLSTTADTPTNPPGDPGTGGETPGGSDGGTGTPPPSNPPPSVPPPATGGGDGPVSTPEPGTLLLAGVGLGAVAWRRRKV